MISFHLWPQRRPSGRTLSIFFLMFGISLRVLIPKATIRWSITSCLIFSGMFSTNCLIVRSISSFTCISSSLWPPAWRPPASSLSLALCFYFLPCNKRNVNGEMKGFTYLDLFFLELDLDILVVYFTMFFDILAQFLEHALHILRWIETENPWLKLVQSNQNWDIQSLILGLKNCFGDSFLIMLFQFFFDERPNCCLSPINFILFLLFLVLETIAL